MAIFDLKNATVKLQDGTPTTPNEIELKLGDGTLSITEKRNIEYKLNRGKLDDVRLGDEEPLDIKLDFNWIFLKGGNEDGDISVEDALKFRGDAADWVSTDADPCRPKSLNIVITYSPPCSGIDKETITLNDFRYEQLDHDAKAGTVSVTGKCNVTEPTSVRAANT